MKSWLLPFALVGCFAEEPGESGGAGTTGEECPVGTLACPCDGERCDDGLACEPSISRCIDPTCTPGSLLCTCVDGLCLEGLQCVDGLCRDREGGTTTGTTNSTQTATTTEVTAGDSTGLRIDIGTPACGQLACRDCRDCAIAPGGDCFAAFDSCLSVPACHEVADCTFGCNVVDPVCVAECCTTYGDGVNEQYNNSVSSCVAMACSGCADDLDCPGGG